MQKWMVMRPHCATCGTVVGENWPYCGQCAHGRVEGSDEEGKWYFANLGKSHRSRMLIWVPKPEGFKGHCGVAIDIAMKQWGLEPHMLRPIWADPHPDGFYRAETPQGEFYVGHFTPPQKELVCKKAAV